VGEDLTAETNARRGAEADRLPADAAEEEAGCRRTVYRRDPVSLVPAVPVAPPDPLGALIWIKAAPDALRAESNLKYIKSTWLWLIH
jgi:hypothetical protein